VTPSCTQLCYAFINLADNEGEEKEFGAWVWWLIYSAWRYKSDTSTLLYWLRFLDSACQSATSEVMQDRQGHDEADGLSHSGETNKVSESNAVNLMLLTGFHYALLSFKWLGIF